ncbi:hypothetical protein PG988_001427 [Apiospora saccharicola]
MGWVFRKAPPHGDQAPEPPRTQKTSWRFAVPARLPFSTEELSLRVLAQVARRARHGRLLQDAYADLIRSASRRDLVETLLRNQNFHLQRYHPQLEWILAGLESGAQGTATRAGRTIEVILKTQLRPFDAEMVPRVSTRLKDPSVSELLRAGSTLDGVKVGGNSGIFGGRDRGPRAPGPEPSSIVPNAHFPTRHHSRATKYGSLRNNAPEEAGGRRLVFLKETSNSGGNTRPSKKDGSRNDRTSQSQRRVTRLYVESRHPKSYGSREGSTSERGIAGQGRAHRQRPPPSPPIPSGPSSIQPAATQDNQNAEDELEEIHELFEEWDELKDKKGKKKSRRKRTDIPIPVIVEDKMGARLTFVRDGISLDPDVSISRMLMRQVEERSERKIERQTERVRKMAGEPMMMPSARDRAYAQQRDRIVQTSRPMPPKRAWEHVRMAEPRRSFYMQG